MVDAGDPGSHGLLPKYCNCRECDRANSFEINFGKIFIVLNIVLSRYLCIVRFSVRNASVAAQDKATILHGLSSFFSFLTSGNPKRFHSRSLMQLINLLQGNPNRSFIFTLLFRVKLFRVKLFRMKFPYMAIIMLSKLSSFPSKSSGKIFLDLGKAVQNTLSQ